MYSGGAAAISAKAAPPAWRERRVRRRRRRAGHGFQLTPASTLLKGRVDGGQGRATIGTIEVAALLALVLALVLVATAASGTQSPVYRIDRVTDGDTVVLRNGQVIRLVQIDTPEVFFGLECYGRAASLATKRLLPPGTRVRLSPEPATDRVDGFGRLLRYVVRAHDGINVNVGLVATGAAAPWFYEGAPG